MTAEEKYVAAAYLVVFAFLLVYVLLIATKLSRLERDVEELTGWPGSGRRRAVVELLFLPALLGYGEAAVAYAGEAWRPGRAGRLATWGVRLGWLAQTALIVARLFARGRVPVGRRGPGSLNLFVWLVVGIYLVWGCRARYRLLGLTIMPLAAGLLLASWLGGGAGASREAAAYSTPFLVFHVGLVLAAFAGFTLAAALSGLYLYEERRLKRRRAGLRHRTHAVARHARHARGTHGARRAARAGGGSRARARPAAGERRRLRRADGAPRC